VVAFQAQIPLALAGGAVPQPSGAHNLETLRLTLAAIRSAERGEAVALGDRT
jgi:predicted dehydrogenase